MRYRSNRNVVRDTLGFDVGFGSEAYRVAKAADANAIKAVLKKLDGKAEWPTHSFDGRYFYANGSESLCPSLLASAERRKHFSPESGFPAPPRTVTPVL